MRTIDVAAAGGAFQWLGKVVVRRPLVVIGLWIAVAATLALALPPLTVIAGERQAPIMPDDAPVLVASREMTEAFHDKAGDNVVLIVLTNENGLGPADEATYRTQVKKLSQDTRDVATFQDFVSTPEVRAVFTSKDNKAWYLPVSLTGEVGSPEA